jgi:hypothetical protein
MNAANGALADAARRSLHQIYAAKSDLKPSTSLPLRSWRAPPAPILRASPFPAYAGSAACRQCHETEFRNWKATGMAKMLRPYSAADVIGRFSGEEILGGGARTGAENGQRFIELRDVDSGKWSRYRVDALIGSKWQQAYAAKLPDGRLVLLTIQYSMVEGGWVNCWKIVDGRSERSDIGYLQGTPEGALYQSDCAPCHTSQLRYDRAGASPGGAVNYSQTAPPFYRRYSIHLLSECFRSTPTKDLLRRRPLPHDDFHRRSLRTITLLPGGRSHLRVVPQSPPGRSGQE